MNTLTDTELTAFASQMNMVLKAGMAPVEGIQIMLDEAEDEDTEKILNRLNDSLLSDPSFSSALEKAEVFPSYMIHMVEIGERTGNLDTVMALLESHYKRADEMKRAQRSAVFYPILLTCLTIFIILVLIIEVMPVFYRVFTSLGVKLSGFSLVLYSLSNWNSSHHAFFFILSAIILVLLIYLAFTESGRKASVSFLSHFSSYQKRQHDTDASELASTLSMALSAGLTPEEGLALAAQLNDNPKSHHVYESMTEEMNSGQDVLTILRTHKVFSSGCLHMCAIGEKTGRMPEVLEQIADLYNTSLQEQADRRIGRMEPILILILSIVIGLILFSIMFPLLNILTGM